MSNIAQFWPHAKIVAMDDADYRFRTTLPREVVGARIGQAVHAIVYDKVKPSVSKDRQYTYLRAWGIMMDLLQGADDL